MKKVFVLSLVLLFIMFSCSKKNEQEMGEGTATTCETANMTFATNIKPILQNFCFGCHGNGLFQNGINFDTYAGVKTVADNGKLVGAISHASGFVAMPQSAPKLSECNINKIKNWVNSGALNN
jgi:hypothetical protein